MIDLGSLAGLLGHRHRLDAYCPQCDRWAELPLAELVAEGGSCVGCLFPSAVCFAPRAADKVSLPRCNSRYSNAQGHRDARWLIALPSHTLTEIPGRRSLEHMFSVVGEISTLCFRELAIAAMWVNAPALNHSFV